MSRSLFGARLRQVFGTRTRASLAKQRRSRASGIPGVESLERRTLLANITASGVISSTSNSGNYDYSITLTNSASSSAAVGTFWYAWIAVPNEDFLATRPISVTPPAGWTDSITHSGSADGYAILYSASSPAYDIQPGSSLDFNFTSADAPASVNGDSTYYPGTPAGTSFVYPAIPFSDSGHQFVVTPAPTLGGPPPSPTTLTLVQPVFNKKHLVTEILVTFSSAVNATEAQETGIYRLVTPGKRGSFTAKNAGSIKLRSAVYNATSDTVMLTPKKAFSLSKPVEVTINGNPPSGLEDTLGRFIDGDQNGTPGGIATAVLRRSGVAINVIARARSSASPTLEAATVDDLLERGKLVGVLPLDRASTSPRANHSHQAYIAMVEKHEQDGTLSAI
jgi:hypothetical protein